MDFLDTVRSQGFYSRFKGALLGNSKQGDWRRKWQPLQYSHLEIPMDNEPGGLEFTGLQRVGSNLACMHASRGTKIMPAILYASLVAQLVKNLPAVHSR